MGNCCGTTSSSSSSSSSSIHYCRGEDRSFLVTSSGNNNNRNHKSSINKVFDESKLTNNKDDNKLHDLLGDLTASSISRSGKIKIKMTKKELQVLLGELEKQKKNNSAEQVLVRLMEARHHRTGQNNWNPVLDSIPEANSPSD
ncbi:hypothetical protein QN277_001227 [Acacia crassicarpa]|uniref:Uncharacterized protein n=1 Tax=Acacia crassicarpa TaxID=499986 RepID=A0AAE1N6Q2_9FABA|nr:hypothetical protein QN277_001227 [Acacia crassicarpa]